MVSDRYPDSHDARWVRTNALSLERRAALLPLEDWGVIRRLRKELNEAARNLDES